MKILMRKQGTGGIETLLEGGVEINWTSETRALAAKLEPGTTMYVDDTDFNLTVVKDSTGERTAYIETDPRYTYYRKTNKTYQWKRDGVNIPGATGTDYVLTASDQGTEISCVVTATFAGEFVESTETYPVAIPAAGNNFPTGVDQVVIIGEMTLGSTLSIDTVPLTDADGIGSISVTWLLDGVPQTQNRSIVERGLISSGGLSFTLTANDLNKRISTLIEYVDNAGNTEVVKIGGNAPIGSATNNVATGLPIIEGSTLIGNDLTVDTTTIEDVDGLGTFSYKWYVNDILQSSLPSTVDTFPTAAAHSDKTIKVNVSFTDGAGNIESLTSGDFGPVIENTPPQGTLSITGTATAGEYLTADISGITDVDGIGIISYQWYRGATPISGATSQLYLLETNDIGNLIKVRISYTDALGTAETVDSSYTSAVASAPIPAPSYLTATIAQNDDINGFADNMGTDIVVSDSYVAVWSEVYSRIELYNRLNNTLVTSKQMPSTDWRLNGQSEPLHQTRVIAVPSTFPAPLGGNVLICNVSEEYGEHSVLYYSSGIIEGEGKFDVLISDPGNGDSATGFGLTADAYTTAGGVHLIAISNGVNVYVYQYTATPTIALTLLGTTDDNFNTTGTNVVHGTSVKFGYGDRLYVTTNRAVRGSVGEQSYIKVLNVADPYMDFLSDVSFITSPNFYSTGFGYRLTPSLTEFKLGVDERPSSNYVYEEDPVYNGQYNLIKTFNSSNYYARGLSGRIFGDITLLLDNNDGDGVLNIYSTSDLNNPIYQIQNTPWTNTIGDAYKNWDAVYYDGLLYYVNGDARAGDVFTSTSEFDVYIYNLDSNNPNAPTGSVTISGTAAEDYTLTLDASSISDADGMGSLTYQWKRNNVPVSGETGTTYDLTIADIGATITVDAMYTDGIGNDEVVTSSTVGPIVHTNHAPTGSAVILGNIYVGSFLQVDFSGVSDPDGIDRTQAFWYADGEMVEGGGLPYYTVQAADLGKTITVTARIRDNYGDYHTIPCDPHGPIIEPNNVHTGTVTITGTTTVGQTLTATDNIADVNGLGPFSYQWYRSSTLISGATSSTYTLTTDDYNKYLRVKITFTDGAGYEEVAYSDFTAQIDPQPVGAFEATGSIAKQLVVSGNNIYGADDYSTSIPVMLYETTGISDQEFQFRDLNGNVTLFEDVHLSANSSKIVTVAGAQTVTPSDSTIASSDNAIIVQTNQLGAVDFVTQVQANKYTYDKSSTIDSSGNIFYARAAEYDYSIYSSGWIVNNSGSVNIMKFSPINGALLADWSYHQGDTFRSVQSVDIKTNNAGNIVCAAYVRLFSSVTRWLWIFTINPSTGALLNSNMYSFNEFVTSSADWFYLNDMSFDSSDNIYVIGTGKYDGTGERKARVFKFNSSGTMQWVKGIEGSANPEGSAVTADGSGNLYLALDSYAGYNNDVMVKMNASTGAIDWMMGVRAYLYDVVTNPTNDYPIFGASGGLLQVTPTWDVDMYNPNGIVYDYETLSVGLFDTHTDVTSSYSLDGSVSMSHYTLSSYTEYVAPTIVQNNYTTSGGTTINCTTEDISPNNTVLDY